MQRGNPTYQDLLIYLAQDLLDQFISRLTIVKSQGKLPVTYTTEVDLPVYCKKKYYHSAICYAVAVDDLSMTESLLRIGANPNVPDLNTMDGSALLIASCSIKPNASQILLTLLASPSIELFVINASGSSIFLLANGDAAFILKLFTFDSLVSIFTKEEKNIISEKIAAATISNSPFETNKTICQTLNEAYLAEEISLENEITEVFPQPLSNIVLSYLFRPKNSLSLNVMENWVLNNVPRPKVQEETKKQCKIS